MNNKSDKPQHAHIKVHQHNTIRGNIKNTNFRSKIANSHISPNSENPTEVHKKLQENLEFNHIKSALLLIERILNKAENANKLNHLLNLTAERNFKSTLEKISKPVQSSFSLQRSRYYRPTENVVEVTALYRNKQTVVALVGRVETYKNRKWTVLEFLQAKNKFLPLSK